MTRSVFGRGRVRTLVVDAAPPDDAERLKPPGEAGTMRDTYLDVTLEVSQREIDAADDPSVMVVEKMRGEADRLCTEVGGYLRTDRNPEIHVRKAEKKLTGEPYFLLAMRWAAVVPDGVEANGG